MGERKPVYDGMAFHRQGGDHSPVATTFPIELHNTLGEAIEPNDFGDHFFPDGAPMYVAEREWEHGGIPPDIEYAYERELHLNYWPGYAKSYRVLIVDGAEGIGKTTLLRFYFDCYLPHLNKFPGTGIWAEDLADWEAELKKHLILYANLRHEPDYKTLERHLYRRLKRRILQVMGDISLRDGCAMWDRLMHWSDPVHVPEGQHGWLEYRKKEVQKKYGDDQIFVEEALWYLCGLKAKDGDRKFYTSIILDNLDQQHLKIQEAVLKKVLSWIGSETYESSERTDLWKVIVPLRPESIRDLEPFLQPYEKTTIRLGPPMADQVVDKRADIMEKLIKRSKRQVEYDVVIAGDPTRQITGCVTAARHLKEAIRVDMEAEQEATEVADGDARITRYSTKLVERFCNKSIRRWLGLRERVAMNQGVAIQVQKRSKQFRERDKEGPIHIAHYTFLGGVLAGGHEYHDNTDSDNLVLNIYNAVPEETPSSYALLVGAHMLQVLKSRNPTKRELIELLTKIGYRHGEVAESLNAFNRCGLVKFGPLAAIDDTAMHRELKIIDTYWELLQNAAYTDNMAVVTPVEDKHRESMACTVSYHAREFTERVKTGISFLRQVRDDELAVSTYASGTDRHYGVTWEAFERNFNDLGLLSVYRWAAEGYRERLNELRKSGALQSVPTEWWEEQINSKILNISDDEVGKMLRAVQPSTQ